MQRPLVVFRVGYMTSYDGPGVITGGGGWVQEHGFGGEMWNFLPEAGRTYGFVMTKGEIGLDLARIAPSDVRWRNGDEYEGVDVVFIARKPLGRQVVIGWYLDAKVFHRQYGRRPNPRAGHKPKVVTYVCEASAENTTLLEERERTFEVPYAPSDGYGPGQSNIWYADSDEKRVLSYIRRLRTYIGAFKYKASAPHIVKKSRGKGWGKPLPKETILAIEKASMDATRKYFRRTHHITEVAKDNRGWDITAKHKRTGSLLHIEVKGHLGDVVQFELTPNEYSKLQALSASYRVCVVRNALAQNRVEVFSPVYSKTAGWHLKDVVNKTLVTLGERVGARARQIA